MRSLALLVLLASCSGGGLGDLHRVSKGFRECCISKGDIDVQRLLTATSAYCNLLARFGRFVGPSVANVRGCIDKVETSRKALRARTKKKLTSLRELGLLLLVAL